MIIRGYTQDTPYHRPVSLRPFRGGRGLRRFPEAKTAANVDMAFLTAAQNLVEMRQNAEEAGRMDGWNGIHGVLVILFVWVYGF